MVQGAYDPEDSIDSWTLTPEDHVRIAGKSRDNRLAFAVLLLFFRANGRFPELAEIHPSIVALVAWLRDHAVAHSHDPEHLTATLKVHCLARGICLCAGTRDNGRTGRVVDRNHSPHRRTRGAQSRA